MPAANVETSFLQKYLLTLPLLEGVEVPENENYLQHRRVLSSLGTVRKDAPVLSRKRDSGSQFDRQSDWLPLLRRNQDRKGARHHATAANGVFHRGHRGRFCRMQR